MRTVLILFGITLLIVLLGVWQRQSPKSNRTGDSDIAAATDANFDEEVLRSKLPVLVDFWAPWCNPCRLVAPAVEDMADEFAGKLKVVKVNIDEAPEIAKRYQVGSIPTLAVFRGGKLQDRKVGVPPGDMNAAMTEWLKRFLE
jgi:thioredoxin